MQYNDLEGFSILYEKNRIKYLHYDSLRITLYESNRIDRYAI